MILNCVNFTTFDIVDEDDFEALRQKRRQNLQKKMKQEQDWKQLGHGRYGVMSCACRPIE